MNYKKIEKKHYNLHLINYDRFKTINVDVYFSRTFKKENIPYLNLLVKMLTYSTKKYNTKNKLAVQSENLYNTLITSRHMNIGEMETILVSLEFINPSFTEESMYEENFDFLKEVLFNPNIKDNAFDENIFEINKKNIIREISIMKEKPNVIAYENFSKEMYKGTSGVNSLFGNIKDYENITCQKLCDFYNEIIKTSKIDIVILGDILEEKVINITNKVFKNFRSTNEKLSLYSKVKIKSKTLVKKEEYKFNQSILLMGYKFENITDYEIKYVLSILNIILGTMNNSILFTKVREENSYCYNISSFIARYNTSLTINSGINRKNYTNVVNKIKECIKLLEDEKTINNLLSVAIKTANTYLNDYYDSAYSILEHYYLNEFDTENDVEKRREIYNKITSKDIILLAKKMKLDTIYLMEGVNENS